MSRHGSHAALCLPGSSGEAHNTCLADWRIYQRPSAPSKACEIADSHGAEAIRCLLVEGDPGLRVTAFIMLNIGDSTCIAWNLGDTSIWPLAQCS